MVRYCLKQIVLLLGKGRNITLNFQSMKDFNSLYSIFIGNYNYGITKTKTIKSQR